MSYYPTFSYAFFCLILLLLQKNSTATTIQEGPVRVPLWNYGSNPMFGMGFCWDLLPSWHCSRTLWEQYQKTNDSHGHTHKQAVPGQGSFSAGSPSEGGSGAGCRAGFGYGASDERGRELHTCKFYMVSYVYMHTSIHIYTYTCKCVHTYMYVCMFTDMYSRIGVCMYVCVYFWIYRHACLHANIQVCIYIYVCTHISVQLHFCTMLCVCINKK